MNNEELSFHTPEDIEPPLSPVLTNTKESRKQIFKKSRVKLLNKFSQSVTQDKYSGTEPSEVYGSLLSQYSISSIEERMKTINDVRNKPKVIYSVKTNQEEIKNVTKENEYETINAKKFCLETLMDSSVGFQTGMGKSITISDRAIARAKNIFDDIIDETCPESDANKQIFTAPENKNEQNDTFKIPTLQVPKKNKSTQKEKEKVLSPDRFTQISDSQICNAIDEAECIAGVSFSQWNFSPGENINLNCSGEDSQDDFEGFGSNKGFQALNTFQDVIKTIQESCTSLETVLSMKNEEKSQDAILDVNFSQFESIFTCESKKAKIPENALPVNKKQIDISEEELKNVKIIFEEDFLAEMKETNLKISQQNSVPNFVGFSTASGKKMNISEKALAKAKSMFEEVSSVDNNKENFEPSVNVTNQMIPEPNTIPVFQGFFSASGTKLKVSEAAMTNARIMFEDLPMIPENFKNVNNEEKSISPFGGFSTASGKKMEISTEVTSKAKMIFADLSEMDNTDTVGFSTAGGKKLKISEEAVTKAQTIFNDLSITSENYQTGINKRTLTLFGGFSTASGKKMQISTEAMLKAKMIFEDLSETEIKESTAGFSTAAGKKFNISEKSLTKAKSMFDDLEVSKGNNTLPSLQRFSTATGKKMQISTEAMSKAEMMFEDLSKTETKENGVGFSTAAGKKLNISEKALTRAKSMFDDLSEVSEGNKTLPSLQGFSTASGKQLKVSEEALKRATSLFEAESTSEGFSTAAGKKMEISKEALLKARIIFEETSLENFPMKPTVPERNIQNISNYSPIPIKIKNVSNISDFTKSPIVSSPIPSTNITPNLRNQSTMNFSSNSRKRKLGLSACKQIELSENGLKKARLIFEDLDVITPKKLTQEPEPKIFQSTPIFNTPLRISPKNTSTPKVETNSSIVYEKDPKTYLSFQEEAVTSYEKTRGNYERKYEMLKLEMMVIEDRMRRLEEQRKIVMTVDKDHRSPKLGYVFIAKSQTSNRITLKQAINGKRPGTHHICFSTPLPKLTPENAQNLHFYTPWFPDKGTQSFPSILRTQDSAVIIPNQNNYVGVSEIESAFLSMPGVDPKLVPDGWVQNHFKWIVWKLGSMERSYPEEFSDCLSIENVMGQLKYRYDREVDRAQRPALRRILERDDAAGKRMVLVVSGVIPTSGGHDLELSDGWYAVRTSIDSGLNNVVQRGLVKIGTKLMIQGAELLNCEGCPPLQVSESVRLKIFFNSTRRAAWDVKLGYYHVQGPLLIPFRSIHNNGGTIGCTRVYVARVYPLCFMEKSEAGIVWRNEKAQLRKDDEREMNRNNVLERLQQQVEDELTMEWRKKSCGKRRRIGKSELEGAKCAKTLYEMMESSIDPDSFKEMLTASQLKAVYEYQNKILLQKQSEMTMRLKEKLSKFNDKNNASPVLKSLLVDVDCIYHNRTFNIWSPTELHISDIKEGNVITLYSITPRNNGTLSSTSRTCIRTEKDFNIDKYDQLRRCVSPIEKILESHFHPFFNEFDTIGIVVYTQIEDTKQTIWLCDSHNRFLSIKVNDGQKNISFDVKIGSVIAVMNLVYRKSNKDVAEAVANTSTVFTTNPQKIHLKNYMYVFRKELPQDFDKYIDECKSRIEAEMEQMLFRFNKLNPFSFKNDNNNTAVSVGGMGCIEMTLSDEELSLLDTTLL